MTELLPANLVTYGQSLAENDPRYDDYKLQRAERGFDDTETWSLDSTIGKFILPRLKRFKEVTKCVPSSIADKYGAQALQQWQAIIQTMIEAFEIISDDARYFMLDPSDTDRYSIGM